MTNDESERWKSIRRCHNCLENGDTNYLWAQKWGKNEDDVQEYRLTCEVCTQTPEISKWDGK